MKRTHIHFASEPAHLRGDDWACVLLQVRLRLQPQLPGPLKPQTSQHGSRGSPAVYYAKCR